MNGARLRLAGLAVVSLAAGTLPWAMGGPLLARLLGLPFLLLSVFAGYAAYRFPRLVPARPYPVQEPPCGAQCRCGAQADQAGCQAERSSP